MKKYKEIKAWARFNTKTGKLAKHVTEENFGIWPTKKLAKPHFSQSFIKVVPVKIIILEK